MNQLTKSGHFLPVKTTYTTAQYVKLYLEKIVSFHGVPLSKVSDRGLNSQLNFGDLFKQS